MCHSWFERRSRCPACASERFKSIYEIQYAETPIKEYLEDFYLPQGKMEFEYLDGASYILCECNDCSLIFQQDVPNDSLLVRLYEYWIDPEIEFERFQKQADLRQYAYFAQEIMQIIAFIGKKPASLCFLDFGMGWGKWALMVKAFGCDSYGAELSQERIRYAEANGIKVVKWEEIPQYQFDMINTEQVFEHLSEPLQTLRYLKKALKTDGILKISVPNANDIERRLRIMDWNAEKGSRNSLNPVAPLEHINCFRRESIIKMAKEAGMEEVFIPMGKQYRNMTDWNGFKKIIKNLGWPIYQNMLKMQNIVFLRKQD